MVWALIKTNVDFLLYTLCSSCFPENVIDIRIFFSEFQPSKKR